MRRCKAPRGCSKRCGDSRDRAPGEAAHFAPLCVAQSAQLRRFESLWKFPASGAFVRRAKSLPPGGGRGPPASYPILCTNLAEEDRQTKEDS